MNQRLTGGDMALYYNRIISKYIIAMEWKMTFLRCLIFLILNGNNMILVTNNSK